MQEVTFEETLEQILAKDPRYQRDAYIFLREALDYTQKLVGKENGGKMRHVTGQELLDGIRQFALEQFGPMTLTVFEEWGVRHCGDFGEIVFNMLEIGLLAKTATDAQTNTTMATRITASRSVFNTSIIDSRTNGVMS